MNQIKFSYPYRKIALDGAPITRAKLLLVQRVKLQELPAEFLDYDTDGGKYKLPATGNYLLLTFLKPGKEFHLFTTLRTDRPGKIDYYLSRIGELFNVVITEGAIQ